MQERIINLLEKTKKPLSKKEISKILNEREEKVSARLKKLLDHKEIFFIDVCKEEAVVKYNCHRRLRIYYL